ncbi:hypothetical protein ABMA28_015655 [Loxostege sticticalis]|uniref:Uncharacterized protein n=1 Tax=Loxostege sticticalis TaxID=481309 RepID=A0ABD0TAI5_LOXSC
MNFVLYAVTVSVFLVVAHIVNAQVKFYNKDIANGEYAYSYGASGSVKLEARKLDSNGDPLVIGIYRYVLGKKQYVVTYTADKNGYHPKVNISDYEPGLFRTQSFNVVASLLG